MKRFRSVAALAAAGSMLATGTLAVAASTTPKSGAMRLFLTNTSPTKSNITITGAIGDYGTTIAQDKSGKADPTGAYAKIILKHGTFIINITGLQNRLAHDKPQVNTSNCSGVFTGTGPGTIAAGTGAYRGISGSVSITLITAGIAPRKGSKCDFANNGPGHGAYQSTVGTGHVSFL